jgi:hypothetical protein
MDEKSGGFELFPSVVLGLTNRGGGDIIRMDHCQRKGCMLS